MLTVAAHARNSAFGGLPAAARTLLLCSIATFLVGMECRLFAELRPFDWRAMQANLAPWGLGVAAAAAAWRFREAILVIAPRRTMLTTLMGSLGIAALIWIEGQRQFGGCDFSELVDVAWRQHIGQKVYRDFICTLPPGFYLGARWAFDLFGASWRALVGMTCLFTAGWMLWATRLLTALAGSRPMAPLLATAVAAMTQVVLGTWWYNPLAMLGAIGFVLSSLLLYRSPRAWFARCSYCASLAIVILMKPNIGGVVIAGVGLVLALRGWRWCARVAGLSAAAAFLAWALLFLNGVSASDVLVSYRSVAGHGLALGWGFRGGSLTEIALSVSMACAFLFPVAADRHGWKAASSVEAWLLAALLAGGVYSALNNGESKLLAGSVALAACTVFVILRGSRSSMAFAAVICAMFAAIGCGTGWCRLRVQSVGDFFEWKTLPPRAAPPFFEGFTAGPRFDETLDQIQTVLSRRRYEEVFFGPRLEFAYAAFAKTPPKRQPVWFEPGTFFGVKQESQILRDWERIDFDLLVFAKNDFTYYSPEFLELIGRRYTRDDSFSRLTLFHPRQSAFATSRYNAACLYDPARLFGDLRQPVGARLRCY